jgi:hypothetical protein
VNDYQTRIDARLLALFDEYRSLGHSTLQARTATVFAFGVVPQKTRERLDELLAARRATPTRTDTGAF